MSDTIRKAIGEKLTDPFESELFKSVLANLDSQGNRLRFNNFCYSIRELLRLILHRHSPDEGRIKRCIWYEHKNGDVSQKISRKDRARFAVQGGLSNDYLKERFNIDMKIVYRELIQSINELCKYTHIERETFNLDAKMIIEKEDEILKPFYDFLHSLEECTLLIVSSLHRGIHEAVIHECLRESIVALDELSSHSSVEEIWINDSQILSIDEENVKILVCGQLECGLQWGSNGDVRRGDGAVGSVSFPFTCELWACVADLDDLMVDEDSLHVDVSSWWDDYRE
ncbi:hypothetical protein ACFL49_00985 [Candidatus Omnitrophota bacterium]